MFISNRPSRPDHNAAGRSPDAARFGEIWSDDYEVPWQDDESEDDVYSGDGWGARFKSWIVWLFTRVGWIALAAVLSLGSAGLVAATAQSPANDQRPELTYDADQGLSDRLDAGVRDLAILNDDVTVLGDMARKVLANLAQVNRVGLSAAYQDGDADVAEIDAGAAALSLRLECNPWPDGRNAELARTYSRHLIDRWRQVCVAIDSVAPLADDWAGLVGGSKVAMQVADDINQHDQAAAAALQQATQGRYPEALADLRTASDALADAQRIDTEVSKVGDVSTLTAWLGRTKTMDDALRLLWQTMIDSKGRVTKQVTAALKAVNDAKALLPENNSVLQVVLYELAGNLTSEGFSIEVAKGQLAAALSDLTSGTVVGS